MRIAFIGFGEAAHAFRESLAATDTALSFAAYDILLHKARNRRALWTGDARVWRRDRTFGRTGCVEG